MHFAAAQASLCSLPFSSLRPAASTKVERLFGALCFLMLETGWRNSIFKAKLTLWFQCLGPSNGLPKNLMFRLPPHQQSLLAAPTEDVGCPPSTRFCKGAANLGFRVSDWVVAPGRSTMARFLCLHGPANSKHVTLRSPRSLHEPSWNLMNHDPADTYTGQLFAECPPGR